MPDDRALCRQRGACHRLGRRFARSRGGGSEAPGHRGGDPVRFDRRRGARGRRRACGDRPRGGDAQPAVPQAGADPVRRRDHRDLARARARAAATANSCSPSPSASTGFDGIHALAADTDGIDGSEDNAGAFCRWLDRGAHARRPGSTRRRCCRQQCLDGVQRGRRSVRARADGNQCERSQGDLGAVMVPSPLWGRWPSEARRGRMRGLF